MNARDFCPVEQDLGRHLREGDRSEAESEYWQSQAAIQIRAGMEPKTPDDWFASTVPGKRCKWSLDEILTEAINDDNKPVINQFLALMASKEAEPLRTAMLDYWLDAESDAVATALKKAAQ